MYWEVALIPNEHILMAKCKEGLTSNLIIYFSYISIDSIVEMTTSSTTMPQMVSNRDLVPEIQDVGKLFIIYFFKIYIHMIWNPISNLNIYKLYRDKLGINRYIGFVSCNDRLI